MNGIWCKELKRAEHLRKIQLQRAEQVVQFARTHLEKAEAAYALALDALRSVQQTTAAEVAEVRSWMKDPIVWARNYGAPKVYHGSRLCGWLSLRKAEPQTLGAALKANLRPCSNESCGKVAKKPRT